MDRRVTKRRSGWFAFKGNPDNEELSGPWRTKEAAEAAYRDAYAEAHRLDRAATKDTPNG